MKRLLLALLVLILLAAAFAGGFFTHRHLHPPAAAAKQGPEPKAKAPPWTEWQYPGSTEGPSNKGGGVVGGAAPVGPLYSVALSTPDDMEAVLKWYAKKFRREIIAVPTGHGGLTPVHSEDKDDPIRVGDVMNAGHRPPSDQARGEWRPVRMKVISVRSQRYDLVINVSRADGEAHTHVVIIYFPNGDED